MAPKRRAAAESTESRKKVRVGAPIPAETPTTKEAARPGHRSKAAAPAASTRSRSTNKPGSDSPTSTAVAIKEDSEEEPQADNTVKPSKGRGSVAAVRKSAPKETKASKKDDGKKTSEQYWLMKAEPEDRFENGYNVKFSIDDLEAASEPEPWDGVRNYVARNNMRDMKKGDLAFFYHSNCKVPGIVGIMRIAQEHTVDESAFDPKHPYYDQKSQKDKPKWDLVHVEFVKKFEDKISLKDIQNNAATTKELSEMDLLKYKRLSVTSVKPHEWKFILNWAEGQVAR